MFWKVKSQLNSAEYEKIWKQVIELNARVDELANKQKIQETNYENLRGNFNRKLSGIKKAEMEEEEEETKSINNPVILPFNGTSKFY
jgi:hypothetical protein